MPQTDDNTTIERRAETLQSIAAQFDEPADAYKPHAWWHWLGSNFSKEGMTKDLLSMKEAGIGGVVIFNAPSWLDTLQNPWRHQTYRSEAYWDAFGHALAEARRLNLKVGVHNTPGWSTTGGTWITPEDGMQEAVFAVTEVTGNQLISLNLAHPLATTDETYKYYKDVAVMAALRKDTLSADDILDISANCRNGTLEWVAPAGQWRIYRFGYKPIMQRSHPTPEDVERTALEADKMSAEATVKHWNNVLNPFKERFTQYIGSTFNAIWIDSYEAWSQNWSPGFRDDFIRLKGYDPVRYAVLAYSKGDSIFHSHGLSSDINDFSPETQVFISDYQEVINRLFLDCFSIGKEMVNKAGFQLFWEPYGSIVDAPFDMAEGVKIADVPVTEFWVHSRDIYNGDALAKAAAASNKRIVGAEAFTGMEATCRFTETPAMLRRPADMGYSYGINMYFLHSWAHNPLSDEWQPGWNFAHYGTHFSRNQTWMQPAGKAFFTYLSRCQMLLQYGSFVMRDNDRLHRSAPDAEIFFVVNNGDTVPKQLTFSIKAPNAEPEIWDAYSGTIKELKTWERQGDSVRLTLDLTAGNASVFVVFPAQKTSYAKLPDIKTVNETSRVITGGWTVAFQPKTNEKPFSRKFASLVDFSKQEDVQEKYFSGTAVYEKTVKISASDLQAGKLLFLDLGKVYDMASLEINGQKAGVLWAPPFRADITPYLRAGTNRLRISVTNTWANRLIGDEQYPEDFEWTDRNQGLRAMKGLPDWFVKGEPRPVKERKTFIPWYYFKKDSRLYPAGLVGPVKLVLLSL
ncbi:MAG: hypothetical protein LBT35_06740 [Tannerella sp.]|nr:hypothetical protein [Tannerella sp.]